MTFQAIGKDNYDTLLDMMVRYYRNAEDADTPIYEIVSFIRYLFDLIQQEKLYGVVAYAPSPVGFVLWMRDSEALPFSELPGLGSIVEIGIEADVRHQGYGRALVAHAEQNMRLLGVEGFYVSAYGPAEAFWHACGFCDTGHFARNHLPLLAKPL